jgi:hypothetical protein
MGWVGDPGVFMRALSMGAAVARLATSTRPPTLDIALMYYC